MAKILFFSEGVDFQIKQKKIVKSWIMSIVESESFHVKQIVFVFCRDSYLLEVNKKFLSHDYYTDVITFEYSSPLAKTLIESDIYISLDRVLDNGNVFGLGFTEELYRVMSHGVLHLLGYKDKDEKDLKKMRNKETAYKPLFHVKQTYKRK